MTLREIKYFVDEHSDAVFNIAVTVGAILGDVSAYYYKNCWMFFPPFIVFLAIFLIVDYWLFRKVLK